MPQITIGVDVGGTFTDLVARDATDGSVRIAKVPTTIDDRARGVLDAITAAGVNLGDVALIVHGTTATTNAVLERTLSRTGLITTAGFRDVLELGRRTRPHAYGMTGSFAPVIPRDLRLEVPERLDARGRVVVALDEPATLAAAERLLGAGCESLLVHFLHSYANPVHERRALELVRSVWPNDFVSAGHELLSEAREYERGVTAAVNAGVRPLLQRYIDSLREALAAGGYSGELLVVNGNGGTVSARHVAQEAIKTVMSGPASGVIAAARTGRQAGRLNLISYDMGGTSTDVAMIRGAEPAVSAETDIEYALPVHVPLVDVRTVGAGGGSIARVDAGGLLQVGPQSAGSAPGPVVYGRGGTRATISDANAILGRLDVAAIASLDASGAARNVEAAARIVEHDIGAPLGGLDTIAAALAILRVADATMAAAIRSVSVSLGADPRDFALFAFGGAGPLHAGSLARELGIPEVLIPARPGITNAIGCLVADLRLDYVDTLASPLESLDIALLHARIAMRIVEGRTAIEAQGVPLQRIEHRLALDMQFIGQTHLLRVPIDDPCPTLDALQAGFEATYFQRFRVRLPEIRAALVNVAVSVIGVRPAIDLATLLDARSRCTELHQACIAERRVHFTGGSYDVPVYRRAYLPADAAFDGPALILQSDTTILVEPGDRVVTDTQGNLILTVQAP